MMVSVRRISRNFQEHQSSLYLSMRTRLVLLSLLTTAFLGACGSDGGYSSGDSGSYSSGDSGSYSSGDSGSYPSGSAETQRQGISTSESERVYFNDTYVTFLHKPNGVSELQPYCGQVTSWHGGDYTVKVSNDVIFRDVTDATMTEVSSCP